MAKKRDRSSGKVADHTPLAPAPLHIVLALNRGERHGYAIMSEVEHLSDGVIKMGPGTLYGSLKKLLGEGLIEETDGRVDPSLDDQRRRYYKLSALGQQVCNAEIQRLTRLVEHSRAPGPPRLIEGTT